MKTRVIACPAILFFLLSALSGFCQNADDDMPNEEVYLTPDQLLELEVTYEGVRMVYEFSKNHYGYGTYISERDPDLEDLIRTFYTVKAAWEIIKEKKKQLEGTQAGELLVNLKTVQALRESAVGLIVKLDNFLAERLSEMNATYLTDELIGYYEILVKKGKKEYAQRLDELKKRKEDIEKTKDRRGPIPQTFSQLEKRYPDCKPCENFYQKSEGANSFIEDYEELAKVEQFPGILHLLARVDKSQPRINGKTQLFIDKKFVGLLDVLYDYQTKKCEVKNGPIFEFQVNEVIRFVLQKHSVFVNELKKTRRDRLNEIKKNKKNPSKKLPDSNPVGLFKNKRIG